MMAFQSYSTLMTPSFLWGMISEQAKLMKILLYAFEQLSGLKINFHKSEMFCYGECDNPPRKIPNYRQSTLVIK
jgi:hypothetical protein